MCVRVLVVRYGKCSDEVDSDGSKGSQHAVMDSKYTSRPASCISNLAGKPPYTFMEDFPQLVVYDVIITLRAVNVSMNVP